MGISRVTFIKNSSTNISIVEFKGVAYLATQGAAINTLGVHRLEYFGDR